MKREIVVIKKINKIMGRDEGRDRGYFRERVFGIFRLGVFRLRGYWIVLVYMYIRRFF